MDRTWFARIDPGRSNSTERSLPCAVASARARARTAALDYTALRLASHLGPGCWIAGGRAEALYLPAEHAHNQLPDLGVLSGYWVPSVLSAEGAS